jgi:hypothetical protein
MRSEIIVHSLYNRAFKKRLQLSSFIDKWLHSLFLLQHNELVINWKEWAVMRIKGILEKACYYALQLIPALFIPPSVFHFKTNLL